MTHQATRVLVATQIEGFYKIPPNHPELDDFRMETHGTHGDFGAPLLATSQKVFYKAKAGLLRQVLMHMAVSSSTGYDSTCSDW
jgi:hypothetical protein